MPDDERFSIDIDDDSVMVRERIDHRCPCVTQPGGPVHQIIMPKSTFARLLQGTGRFGQATVVMTKEPAGGAAEKPA